MSADLVKARIMTVMRNLPPLPEVTRKLLVIMRDENASADDVTKILSGDGTLAAKVLKLVNSSFYGLPSEVTTISRAVVILGFTGIRNLALGFGSVEALSGMKITLDMGPFWAHAMSTAAAAQSLAPYINRRTDPEEAFIAGLMHDIGAYVLAAAVPDDYGEILKSPASERLLKEQEQTGFTHSKVGQGLLKFWELPEAFCNAARYHHDVEVASGGDQPLTNLVALADILSCIHGGDFETDASENDLNRLRKAAGLKPEHLHTALEAMDEKLEEMAEFMKIAGTGSSAKKREYLLPTMKCVVVSTDEPRREMVTALLNHLGHEIFPMESYFNQEGGSSEVKLVLVDPQALTRDQLDRLTIFLEDQPTNLALLVEPGTTIPDSMSSWATLNFLFGGKQLSNICQMQPS
jgi:HD-like signal output (HDOD) protein